MGKRRQTNPRTKMVSDGCGLGLKLLKVPSCNDMEQGMMMMMPHHNHHNHRRVPSSSSCSGGGDGSGSGPLFSCCSRPSSNPVPSSPAPDFTHMYHHLLAPPPPADVFPAVAKSIISRFHSTGEMSATVSAIPTSPFTPAQLQELERQTMIFKYLMASLPDPTTETVPKIKPSNMPVSSSLELKISTSTGDPEPWRCKRTDGKKWRCSRDVTPDHKFCDRHAHKSRSRSRKPVEFHIDSNSYLTTTNQPDHLVNYKPILPSFPAAAAIPCEQPPRNLEWFFKGETNAVPGNSSRGWQHMSRDDKDCNFQLEHSKKHQASYCCSLQDQWLGNDDHFNGWFSSLPKSTCLDAAAAPTPQGQETRHFLDSWSATIGKKNINTGVNNKKCAVASADKALPLTLSMCGGGSESTETSYEEVEGNGQVGEWLPHGSSWPMSSPPGGPLAEALCLGISSSAAKSPQNLASGTFYRW